METMIDVKAKNYENNQTVLEIVEELKASYKQQILDKNFGGSRKW